MVTTSQEARLWDGLDDLDCLQRPLGVFPRLGRLLGQYLHFLQSRTIALGRLLVVS